MVVGVKVPHGIAVLLGYPDPSGCRLCHAPAMPMRKVPQGRTCGDTDRGAAARLPNYAHER
jgi:hypothetical protein